MINVRVSVVKVLDNSVRQEGTHDHHFMERIGEQRIVCDVVIAAIPGFYTHRDKIEIMEFLAVQSKLDIGKLTHHSAYGKLLVTGKITEVGQEIAYRLVLVGYIIGHPTIHTEGHIPAAVKSQVTAENGNTIHNFLFVVDVPQKPELGVKRGIPGDSSVFSGGYLKNHFFKEDIQRGYIIGQMNLTALAEQSNLITGASKCFKKADGIVKQSTVSFFRQTQSDAGTNECIQIERVCGTNSKIQLEACRRCQNLAVIQTILIRIQHQHSPRLRRYLLESSVHCKNDNLNMRRRTKQSDRILRGVQFWRD